MNSDYKSVLVTGGAGFIGSHLVDRLLAMGMDVAVVDNFDPFYAQAVKEKNIAAHGQHPNYRLFQLDITNREALDEAMRVVRPDAVIHLAARAGVRPSVESPSSYVEFNVLGTINVLESARQHGIAKFVFGSSSSVYGDNKKVPFSEEDPVLNPASPYGATKVAGEALCESFSRCFGLPVVALRFFTVYGPRQRPDLAIHKFARLMLEGRPIQVYGDGASERDYTYVTDVVDGIIRALHFRAFPNSVVPYRVFNIGSDRPVRLQDLVRMISGVMGVNPVIERLPEQVGDVQRTWADLSRSRAELGYAPTTSLQEGMERFKAWLLEEAV